MSTARARPRFARVPHRVIVPGLVVGAAVAGIVLAGAQFGALALVLCIPAGVLASMARRSAESRHQGLRLLSQQDALTGLGNRRMLHERLTYEIARHRRHSRRFALLALDLDGFKQVNDRFGHLAGDEVLREVARSLQRACRDQDTVVRLGGDEFCVLAPEIGQHQAEQLAERLRRAVHGSVGGLEMLSVSVGFALFPDEGWTPEHLLQRADAAEAAMKRQSRAARGVPRRAA
jgi:diguanylate cyclase (GGDEF)-like protein